MTGEGVGLLCWAVVKCLRDIHVSECQSPPRVCLHDSNTVTQAQSHSRCKPCKLQSQAYMIQITTVWLLHNIKCTNSIIAGTHAEEWQQLITHFKLRTTILHQYTGTADVVDGMYVVLHHSNWSCSCVTGILCVATLGDHDLKQSQRSSNQRDLILQQTAAALQIIRHTFRCHFFLAEYMLQSWRGTAPPHEHIQQSAQY